MQTHNRLDLAPSLTVASGPGLVGGQTGRFTYPFLMLCILLYITFEIQKTLHSHTKKQERRSGQRMWLSIICENNLWTCCQR